MEEKIAILNDIVSRYNQYKPSELQKDIDAVLECGSAEATKKSKSHCNLVSFWALNVASGITDLTYADFFYQCLKKKYCQSNGNILVQKTFLSKKIFDFEFEVIQFKDYEDVLNPEKLNPEKLYQMRIINGSHFMSCYLQDGVLMLSDTSKRGIGVIAAKASRVDADHFAWILQIG